MLYFSCTYALPTMLLCSLECMQCMPCNVHKTNCKLLHRQRWAVHVSMHLRVHVTPQGTWNQCILVVSPFIYQVQTDFHLKLYSVFDHTDQGSLQTWAWVFANTKHSGPQAISNRACKKSHFDDMSTSCKGLSMHMAG